ncbi:hypothetical protein Mapa_016774 [Marchantia paleacea]|nr:hypothetical protein Mapa_016774 [Marchantia paleacea]
MSAGCSPLCHLANFNNESSVFLPSPDNITPSIAARCQCSLAASAPLSFCIVLRMKLLAVTEVGIL